jgi:hypothetical protein
MSADILIAQLVAQTANAGFVEGGVVRVKDPAALLAALQDMRAEIERLRAALATALETLENISDNGGDTLTIEDAVRIADAALARIGGKT